ncbi:hypothetical protein ACT5YT_01720 [Leuconostoc suionicum]|uniref:hypothetical protein n=1 Tax=Leuconostoc suionicum TaxID=1511761 RepID=UPI004035A740
MFWFKKKTLQERVDAQKAKDLRNALRTWEHGVEPFLIKQGISVKMISDYKELYFSDSRVESRLLPRIDSKSGKAKWSLRPAPTKPTKQ